MDERAERLVWVLAFALLVCLRLPDIIIHGRFWAEEGNPIFQGSWTQPWYRTLTATYGNYVILPSEIAVLLARHLVPLEFAPYVTTFVALLIQLCPAILIATARDEWLQGRTRLIAALLLVATTPVSEEVWLETIQAQVHLALCAALILSFDLRKGGLHVFRLLLLLLAALSGPGSWFLAPLFAMRAIMDRSPDRAVQGAVLALGAAIQLLFFFHLNPSRTPAGPRMQLLIFFVRHLLIPLLGDHQATVIATPLRNEVVAGHAPLWPMFVTVLVFGASATVLALEKIWPAGWMFLAAVILAVVGYVGALAGRENLLYVFAGQRYSYAPAVLFALSALAVASLGRGWTRFIATSLVVWLIVVGALDYFTPSVAVYARGPDWRSQVAAWRADPSHPLAIWPDFWPPMQLPADSR